MKQTIAGKCYSGPPTASQQSAGYCESTRGTNVSCNVLSGKKVRYPNFCNFFIDKQNYNWLIFWFPGRCSKFLYLLFGGHAFLFRRYELLDKHKLIPQPVTKGFLSTLVA